MNDIANSIKDLRKKKGLSQEQMAEKIHVTRQTVSAWERGIAQPSLDTLGEIARALGVETEQLLYGRAAEPRRPAYRGVSFWPVLGILPVYFLFVMILLPIIMIPVIGGSDGNVVIVLCGQMFLAMLVVGCYCLLKDEIRNRDYYDKIDEDEEG